MKKLNELTEEEKANLAKAVDAFPDWLDSVFSPILVQLLSFVSDSIQMLQRTLVSFFDSAVCSVCGCKAHEHTENDWKLCVAKLAPS